MVFDNFQPKIRSFQSSLFLFVLYFIVLYCIVSYFIVLYCIVLKCIAMHCNALQCIALYNAWDEAHEILSFTSDFSSSMANKDA